MRQLDSFVAGVMIGITPDCL